MRTRRRTPSGSASRCRPRPSGSTPRAAGWTARCSPGATSSRRSGRMMANTWQGEFPWQNLLLEGTRARRRSARSRRTATACTTWPGTSGSGRPTSTRRAQRTSPSTPAARRRKPAGRVARRELRLGRRARHSPPRDQGRLAPLRAELLPALPTRGAAGARRSTRRPATSASAAWSGRPGGKCD